jgi:CHAT domain-containing protein
MPDMFTNLPTDHRWGMCVHGSTATMKAIRCRPSLRLQRRRNLGVLLAGLIAPVAIIHGPGLGRTPPELSEKVMQMERDREAEFEDFFGEDLAEVSKGPDQIAAELAEVSRSSGQQSALLYAIPRKSHLHLVLILPGGTPIVRDLYEVPDSLLLRTAADFHRGILSLDQAATLRNGRQLYDWIIAPYRRELADADIDLLLLCLGDGLKGLAFPALHDGQKYLVESFALTRIPAYNLIDATVRGPGRRTVLAAGASTFQSPDISPLPAVEIELETISRSLAGKDNAIQRAGNPVTTLRNQRFTAANLNRQLSGKSYQVVHLASHARFRPGQPHNSYLQFWDSRLSLDQFDTFAWSRGDTQLLVLSACETNVGDTEAENGFAGLALKAGVPSAIGTLWPVSDVATMSLMTDFHRRLRSGPTKAAALRSAQVALLRGNTRVENGALRLDSGTIRLTTEVSARGSEPLSLPYYWAGFSLISNPW